MRLLCKVTGCVYDDYCSCARCGRDIYDGFIGREESWLRHVYHLRNRWIMKKFYRHHECAVCNQWMFLTDDYCCSEKCYDQWVPF